MCDRVRRQKPILAKVVCEHANLNQYPGLSFHTTTEDKGSTTRVVVEVLCSDRVVAKSFGFNQGKT